MVVFNRLIFGLFLFGLVLAGCTQPPVGQLQVVASPSVTVLPSSVAATGSPTPVVPTTPFVSQVATEKPRVPYIPSAKPTVLPSSTAAPSVNAGIPSLVEFVAAFNSATNKAFNDSRKAYETAENVWAIDNTTAAFRYTIFIRPSKARFFSAFDTVRPVYGASGLEKNVSLTTGETGPFYSYSVVMKCYDAHYDVELSLFDFTREHVTSQYRRTLGPAVMLKLVDACPN